MRPNSLRLRLLGGAALWIVLALLAAGAVIGWMFIANVERGVRDGLVASLNRLTAIIDPGATPPVADDALPDPRYATPFSGVYWQVEEPLAGSVWRSRSLWDQVLATSDHANGGSEHFTTLPGPGGHSLSALLREVRFTTPAGKRAFLVTLAESRAVLDESIRRFGADLALALAVLGVALVIAAALQVQLGLRPLHKVQAAVAAVRRGELRGLPDDYPSEVLPLVGEVNELLALQQKSVAFARSRAADLAHGLKTPLSVVSTLGARLAERGDIEGAQLLDQLAEEMNERVEYQLRLSRLHLRTGAHQLTASLNLAVDRTLEVLKRTPDGERLVWEASMAANIAVDMDPQDLIELIGILLENAGKWAKGKVQIIAEIQENIATLSIADDGPGLQPEQLASLGVRGQRFDEATRGHGLGLAIAIEIATINNAGLSFARAAQGGLLVMLTLPLAKRA